MTQIEEDSGLVPKLLVSVRSPAEAVAAIDGGAEIVDVKEPSRGALGLADLATIAAVHDALRRHQGIQRSNAPQLSIALGELVDWDGHPEGATQLPTWSQSVGHRIFVKAGPAGLTCAAASGERLAQRWQRLMAMFQAHPHSDRAHDGSSRCPTFVCVAYADHVRSASPAPRAVLEDGIAAGCRTFLIDTWQKDASQLTDWLGVEELIGLRRICADAGLNLALAGRINHEVLPEVLAAEPDIIGVRGAVCESGQRDRTLTAPLVRQFRTRLRTAGLRSPA